MTDAPSGPRAERPSIPGYGIPESDEGLLPWSWVSERLEAATQYWVASVRPDGSPHAVPTWGAWVDSRFWFEAGFATVRARNIAANPAVVVHTERGSDVVIVEGIAELQPPPDPELEARLLAGFAKYTASHGYNADPASWRSSEGGLWAVRPVKVLAWSSFPTDTSRWRFTNFEGPRQSPAEGPSLPGAGSERG
jgi:hypothetical protein